MSYCRRRNTPRTLHRRHRYHRRIVREGIRRAPRDPLIATLDRNTYVATVNGVRYDVHLHYVDADRAYVLVRAPDGRIGGVDRDGSILCNEDWAGWARGGRTSQRRRRYDVLVAVRDAWGKLRISALFAHAKKYAVSIATRNK